MVPNKRKIALSLFFALFLIITLLWLLFRACNSPLLERSVYYIGRDSTWYPLDLRGKEKNMSGFAGDLLQAIGDEEGFLAVMVEVGPNVVIDGLKTGHYDAMLSSLVPTVRNKDIYGFSDIIYRMGPVLIIPENVKATSIGDLIHKVIGIETTVLQTFSIPESLDVVIIPFDSAAVALESLDKNILDGVILDPLRAYVYTHGYYSGRLKVAGTILANTGWRVITKNTPDSLLFLKHVNDGLKKVKEKGIYTKLIEKWSIINTEPIQ
jgi:polar amino acid transport system substrate-binding protein